VRIWDPITPRPIAILEGHTNFVIAIQFSPSGNFLVSRSQDNTYRVWRVKRWDVVSTIKEISYLPLGGIAFHSNKPLLAIKGVSDNEIGIWEINEEDLSRANTDTGSTHYVNARVVLTGDTGVGKSALSLVLTGKQFVPTDSTHSRKVWTLDSYQLELPTGGTETREMLLWDLAGQPGYRLIHQLYLTEVAVALVVFDARSETDPFSGVRHWERALRHAQSISNTTFPMKKILVAARCDRGALPVSRGRIESIVREMDYVDFIETSAKEGIGVAALLDTVKNSLDWEQLPKVSSNELFQSIKQFLFYEKQLGRVIASVDDLFNSYLHSDYAIESEQRPIEEFETCIGLVESRGLIQRLSFGRLILLQPELLDAYASSMIEAAKQEPDGLGSIKEIDAREGRFFVPSEIRLKDSEQEKLLCIATVENLLRHELALRQDSNSGTFLVFPTQFTRNWEEAPNPTGEAIKYIFEGPVYNIYARLAVRLSHSGVFKRKDMWRNACSFSPTSTRGTCGVHLNASDEGKAELSIFFGGGVSAEIKSQFDEFVSLHLKRHALRETIEKQLILQCRKCKERFPPKAVQIRLHKGLKWIRCSVCDSRMKIDSALQEWSKWQAAVVSKMEQTADRKREQEAAVSVLHGKQRTQDYDVFISYSSRHKDAVLEIARNLKEHAILPWVDVWELRPGIPWQKSIETVISNINSAAIVIGPHPLSAEQKEHLRYLRGEKTPKKKVLDVQREMEEQNLKLGPWQDFEAEALIREFVRRGCPVIPVILPGVKGTPKVPGFLESMTFVDFRKSDPDPLQMLLFGITGKKSHAHIM
jgi:small GTP-binding protein